VQKGKVAIAIAGNRVVEFGLARLCLAAAVSVMYQTDWTNQQHGLLSKVWAKLNLGLGCNERIGAGGSLRLRLEFQPGTETRELGF
jgi:hypothetical protein